MANINNVTNNNFRLVFKPTDSSMIKNIVWNDDHKLLQELTFTCMATTQRANHVIPGFC